MADERARINEAKAIVAMAFRNGPIEDVHAGDICTTCSGKPQYSHITNAEMKVIMKTAVDRVYTMLRLKEEFPEQFDALMQLGTIYAAAWNEPVFQPIDVW